MPHPRRKNLGFQGSADYLGPNEAAGEHSARCNLGPEMSLYAVTTDVTSSAVSHSGVMTTPGLRMLRLRMLARRRSVSVPYLHEQTMSH